MAFSDQSRRSLTPTFLYSHKCGQFDDESEPYAAFFIIAIQFITIILFIEEESNMDFDKFAGSLVSRPFLLGMTAMSGGSTSKRQTWKVRVGEKMFSCKGC